MASTTIVDNSNIKVVRVQQKRSIQKQKDRAIGTNGIYSQTSSINNYTTFYYMDSYNQIVGYKLQIDSKCTDYTNTSTV